MFLTYVLFVFFVLLKFLGMTMMNERRNVYKSKGFLWVYVDFIFGEISYENWLFVWI